MNILVIPDGAMIVVPLIEKNGHNYLSPSNFSKYDNEVDLNPDFNIVMSSETPSGVRGRISLLINLLDKIDAAIILGKRPSDYKPMYNVLNELILFGSNGCNNAYSLEIYLINKMNIPVLKLKYPTTQNEIITIINKVNLFLVNFDTSISDDLNTDCYFNEEKIHLDDFKKILNKSI